jgi:hypothetical protein
MLLYSAKCTINLCKMQTMKAHIVIPIETGPRLTPAEIAAFVARETDAGREPSESLAILVADAIRADPSEEVQP